MKLQADGLRSLAVFREAQLSRMNIRGTVKAALGNSISGRNARATVALAWVAAYSFEPLPGLVVIPADGGPDLHVPMSALLDGNPEVRLFHKLRCNHARSVC